MVTSKPLRGVYVLDFSLILPGPYCTHLLETHGAQVTSVKPPQGDLMQALSLPYFNKLHRGKRLLTLNLKDTRDRDALEPLLQAADILVEGFRPGVMARLGLDYPTLCKHFPRLIYCSVSGYGQTGPLSQRAGHDLNYLAESGLLQHFIEDTRSLTSPPIPLADLAGGALAAIQRILLSLYEREKTGKGQYLDIGMTDSLRELLLFLPALQAAHPGANPPFLPFFASPRYRVYPSQDGEYFALACIEEKFWEAFCLAVEKPEWLDSKRYAGARNAMIPDTALSQAIEALFKSRNSLYWDSISQITNTCLSRVKRYAP